MIVRSRAPLRISFAGGGTDVSPYPETKGGAVLSTTIDMYAYASAAARADGRVVLESANLRRRVSYAAGVSPPPGPLQLLTAAVDEVGAPAGGLSLAVHSDARPGSGLGSSSSVVVAALAALRGGVGREVTDHGAAEAAFRVERIECGIKGGRQDQYAAVFGGLNYIEFGDGQVAVHPLAVAPGVLLELEYNLVLCYTGKTRLDRNIIGSQQEAYRAGRPDVAAALDSLKELAARMRDALVAGDLEGFAALMSEGWECKKRLAAGVTDQHIDRLYGAAIAAGATGGKLLGAGGGGYLLLYCPRDSQPRVIRAARRLGGRPVRFGFSKHGTQTWTVT